MNQIIRRRGLFVSNFFPPKNYESSHYIANDLSAKLTWYFHTLFTTGVKLNGMWADEGKKCDLYSETEEYELMHNQTSWIDQDVFPFAMQKIHKRKNPDFYCREGIDSYFVQFREDYKLAQVTHSKYFSETYSGFQAPVIENKSQTIRIHPVAHHIGNVSFVALKRIPERYFEGKC